METQYANANTFLLVVTVVAVLFTMMAILTSKDVLPGLYSRRPKRKAVQL